MEVQPPPKSSDAAVPRTTVVIVTYNKCARICDLISRIIDHYERSVASIVVVDNHSSDGTSPAIAERFGESVRLIRTAHNTGGSGGFIAGMAGALDKDTPAYLWLLDDDVEVQPDTLHPLLGFAQEHPEAGAVGSAMLQSHRRTIVNEAGGYVDWARGRLMHHCREIEIDELPKRPFEVEFCAAASLLIRTEALRSVGTFRDFFLHLDDVEFCLRLRARGFGVYCVPASRIYHDTARTKPVTWIRYYDVRNLLYLYDAHGPKIPTRVFLRLVLLMVYFMALGLPEKSVQIVAALRDHRRGLEGVRSDVPHRPPRPVADLVRRLAGRRCHLVAPDAESMRELLEVLLEAGVRLGGRACLIYSRCRPSEVDRLEQCYGVRVIARTGGRIGRCEILAAQLRLSLPRSGYSVIHEGFLKRFMLPRRKKRCFVYPVAKQYTE